MGCGFQVQNQGQTAGLAHRGARAFSGLPSILAGPAHTGAGLRRATEYSDPHFASNGAREN